MEKKKGGEGLLWRCSELLTYNYTVCNKKYDTEFELLRAMRGEQSPLQKKEKEKERKRKWKERQNACEQRERIAQKCVRRPFGNDGCCNARMWHKGREKSLIHEDLRNKLVCSKSSLLREGKKNGGAVMG